MIWICTGVAALTAAIVAIAISGWRESVTRADVAIVLGTRVLRDGTPARRLAARLGRALELWLEGAVSRIIVSGGPGPEGVHETDVMLRWLVERGVPESSVLVDRDGVDTWATGANAARMMGAHGLHTAIVVSQYFHVPRARLALRHFGVDIRGQARPRFLSVRDIYSLARELAAWSVYVVRISARQRGQGK